MDLRAPLRCPPEVVQLGLNLHGRRAEERYRMPGLWGLHLYHYSGSVVIDGTRCRFTPGCVSLTPPDTALRWRFPAHAPHHYALLRFPAVRPEDLVAVPAVVDLGGPAAGHAEALRAKRALAVFASHPQHAQAWAWDLLWRLVPAPARGPAVAGVPGVADAVPPALQVVLTMLELELERPHTLTGLAARAGVSPNQLLRLFRRHCGDSAMGWLRRRRGERARALLTGTHLPLADIARAVGSRDLHSFNKLVRRVCGVAPRQVRAASAVPAAP